MDITNERTSNIIDVLCCRITIGDSDLSDPMDIKDPIVITEVLDIEIHESFKKLIGTAKVRFPKGCVYRSTIIGPGTMDGVDTSKITAEVMRDGVVMEQRSYQEAIDKNTFKTGQRINIKLGYNGDLKTMFNGYISAYNSDSIFEIHCENMAYALKLKQAPKFETPDSGATVEEIFGEKYGLLKGTKFQLHSETKKSDIRVGKIKITDNYTVADVLNAWSRFRIYCFLKYDSNTESDLPSIAIGRPYSSTKGQEVFDDRNDRPYRILFDYHVASDELQVLNIDPKFLAVRGQALGENEKFMEATVRLNPDYDPGDKSSKEFQTINATQLSKKEQKLLGYCIAEGAETKQKVDLSTYTVVPYMSKRIGISPDELVEECQAYFKNYNLNGISGSVTIFGDYGMPSAVQVELVDNRNSSKNGVYLVEEVTTKFGTSGYRQKLTIPYKFKGPKSTDENKQSDPV